MSALSRTLSPDELALRLRQQELVAEFGRLALSSTDLDLILHEACAVSALGLNAQLAKILEYREHAADFLVVAGVGWRAGVVGTATLSSGTGSPAGYGFLTGEPVLANNLSDENRFRMPDLLATHGAHSALNVVIGPAGGDAFGILEVDSTHRHRFLSADSVFLQAIANAVAGAIGRARAETAKHRLLREKDVLMQEVHHRVKNSLQLVHGVLQAQARRADPSARRALDDAARRIMTIGAVHQRLYTGPSVSETNAAEFLEALLDEMRPLLDPRLMQGVQVVAPSLSLSADATTCLGVVVTELVTNAVKYGVRPRAVTVSETPRGLLVTVEDDGPGFPPGFDPYAGAGLGMRLLATLASPAPNAITIDSSAPHGRISVLLKR
jgi:two-component sensor histidine kinase